MKPLTRPSVVCATFAIAIAALFMACGSNSTTAPTDGPFTGTIHVLDNHFSPASVSISVGDSVTWRWEGTHEHTVTEGTSPTSSHLFDTPLKTTGTFGYRFNNAGTIHYFCRPHFSLGMKGTITVKA
jgi:plastocyanin